MVYFLSSMNPFFELSLVLALATVVAVVMQRLRLPLLLGHILTGVLAGPAVLQILHGQEVLSVFSQLGITALLFVVGLSLNPTIIREVGKVALFTGIGQILFTTVVGFGLTLGLGYPWVTSLFLAVALTFSSTIIIMKLLSDRGEEHSLYGKISMGFLLVQDLVATIILILVSSLSKDGNLGQALLLTAAKTFGLVLLLSLIGRYLLPRLSRMFAQSQELLLLFSVGWGVGMAALFSAVGLSVEIGALAAGVVLASSPYRFEVAAKMKLLRDFFIVLFFVLLGSHLAWDSIAELMPHAIILSLFILIGNPLIVMAIMRALRYSKKTGFYAGLTVAQISEFSLILMMLLAQKGYVDQRIVSLATIVGIITIAGSTIMILKADTLYSWLAPYLNIFEPRAPIKSRTRKEAHEAYVFGCNRVGVEFIAPLQQKKIKHLVIDFDPSVIERLKQQGIACRYGDAHDKDFLDELNFASCKILISTIPDPETNILLLQKLQKQSPESIMIASANTPEQAERLYESGASYVILPHFLGGNHTAMLLQNFGLRKAKFHAERAHHLKYLQNRLHA